MHGWFYQPKTKVPWEVIKLLFLLFFFFFSNGAFATKSWEKQRIFSYGFPLDKGQNYHSLEGSESCSGHLSKLRLLNMFLRKPPEKLFFNTFNESLKTKKNIAPQDNFLYYRINLVCNNNIIWFFSCTKDWPVMKPIH